MAAAEESADLARHVDPLIGSDAHGHVFVGASVPFGAVQVGPNNVFQGWDWCSGYHYSDDVLIGFSHLHLSGTGCPDLGDVLLLPGSGEPGSAEREASTHRPAFSSQYSHQRETANAGYYAVDLFDYDVRVELTATERVGFHRYTFQNDASRWIYVDLQHGSDDRTTAVSLDRANDTTLVGERRSSGWAKDQRVYFAIVLDAAPSEVRWLDQHGKPTTNPTEAVGALVLLPAGIVTVQAKVGISPVSVANAQANIDAEVPHWDFDAVRQDARGKWNDALQSIEISTIDDAQLRVFYTALYHTMIAPAIFQDVNGDYRGADGQVHRAKDFVNYSVLSLWDTYRAAHPLLTITQPKRVNDFVNTMLAIHDEQGKLPVWHLMGNETDTMVGYHAVPVIADAYLKGFRGFDAERALAAMQSTATRKEHGLQDVQRIGYVAADSEWESVAKGLEYAIDDWCIAAMAKRMGKDDVHAEFGRRAQNYRNYFDAETGFMRGKLADGSWRTPFDPASSKHRRDDFCEGNAWQYTWLVPHDVDGLIELLGGADPFNRKLGQLFTAKFTLNEEASADISGLIGLYAHGNEPGHHIPYLHALAGQPGETAERVRFILNNLYTDKPDGLCGNEDCGQMSAWYVFSALGFYPVQPAGGQYVFGSPIVKHATIRLPDNKRFEIVANNNSPENIYIQSAELNGQPIELITLTHEQIVAGGKLVLMMGSTPIDQRGNTAFRPADNAISAADQDTDAAASEVDGP